MYDTAQVNFLGSNQRKSFLQVKAHLIAKTTLRAGTGAVTFMNTIIEYMLKQIEVLLHERKLRKRQVVNG